MSKSPLLRLILGTTATLAASVAVALMVSGGNLGGSQFSWYAARAAGMIAYILATASVLFGLATSTKLGGSMLGKGNVPDIHRALSLLTLFAIGGHMLFLALDQYASFSPGELLIPFVTWYRPFWTGIGIIAAYLTVALYVSFYIRAWIGYKMWRAFHYAAFGVFVMATFHGLFSGTDGATLWADALYGGGTMAVVALLAYRIISGRRDHNAVRGRAVSGLPQRGLSLTVGAPHAEPGETSAAR